MHEYELVFIAKADLDETLLNDVINRVQSWITDAGGEIVKVDLWGKRRLAYPIRKQTEGIYVLMNVKMDPKLGATLERNLGLAEAILRFLLITK